MADQWFVQRNGQRFGPYSAAQLKAMTTTGQVLPVDLVAKGEGGRWVPASQIKGLFNTPSAQAVPPAPVVPPLVTGAVPPPVPNSTSNSAAAVEIVDRKAIPTNPVAMALLSGLILIPVGHIFMGQVLKAVVVLFAAPWLMVSLGFATGGLGLPVVMLAYAAIMGTDAYLLALKRSAGEPVGPWDTPVVGKLLGAKGLLPARIAMPVLGMLLVVGSGLCLSFFGVKVALFDDSDLRNQLLVAASLFHCVFAVIAIVLTARLQHAIAAPVAAVLTMTAWGWYCFATIPPIASILGLMAGISIGAWALFTFRSPDVKAMFADADKPGPLDRLGTPVLAGAAGGLLVLILGIGGVLYMVVRDKAGENYTASSGSGRSGDRQMKERTMPPPRQMKERTMKERTVNSRVNLKRFVGSNLSEVFESIGKADEQWGPTLEVPYVHMYTWDRGDGAVDVVVARRPANSSVFTVERVHEHVLEIAVEGLWQEIQITK